MLPRLHRLTRPDDFRRTIRGGTKAATPTVIVYGLTGLAGGDQAPARVGVTVSKAVGGSVVRHRVARQIRHAFASQIDQLPQGSTWVVRALPAAGDFAKGRSLSQDVQRGLTRVLGAS